VPRPSGRLEDHHVPAPPAQGPGAGQSEQPGSDHNAAAVLRHASDHTNPCRQTPYGKGAAVRSAAVTNGMGASTHAVHDAIPSKADQVGVEAAAVGHGQAGPGRSLRGLRAAGFHIVALACFTGPAIVLWWHVWSAHPSSSLTCGCGDPAQQVWFTAWPAWAITHLHSVFFSGVVNVPHGANLLSNTSGPLVGVVLAPVTLLFGPVTATNVALTLAPGLSAWACFAAIRPWSAGKRVPSRPRWCTAIRRPW